MYIYHMFTSIDSISWLMWILPLSIWSCRYLFDMLIHFLWIYTSSGITGHVSSNFSFVRDVHTIFNNGSTNLQSCQQEFPFLCISPMFLFVLNPEIDFLKNRWQSVNAVPYALHASYILLLNHVTSKKL